MGRLAGKRILMSAAGQGIGRALALMMAAEGAKVFAKGEHCVSIQANMNVIYDKK